VDQPPPRKKRRKNKRSPKPNNPRRRKSQNLPLPQKKRTSEWISSDERDLNPLSTHSLYTNLSLTNIESYALA
jgi:hypothetical protein